MEEHTGISKDFNSFELLNAVIRKDHLKANRIVNYFEANPKNNPLVLTITALFRYFLNLLTYHYQKRTTPNTQEMAKILGVHPFFMKDYIDGPGVQRHEMCRDHLAPTGIRHEIQRSGQCRHYRRGTTERTHI